ncbi:Uncharacterised protein [Vibrio cholerae]|nr:Uncharacterised protein [Vibrio cholerae]
MWSSSPLLILRITVPRSFPSTRDNLPVLLFRTSGCWPTG